jgi:hypothetical protein
LGDTRHMLPRKNFLQDKTGGHLWALVSCYSDEGSFPSRQAFAMSTGEQQ